MLRSKYFWIALVILIPFIIIWIMEGLAWAVGVYIAIAGVTILILGGTRRRRRKIYYYYDNDDDDEIIIEQRPRRSPSSSDRVRDLYFPKGLRNIHQDGLNDLGQRQRDDLNRTLRRLRR